MSTVIKVEGLGKQYRLGEVGTGTLSHDLNRWWARMRGKEDPFSKIGEINDRTHKGESEYVWALKDINFEVKQGDILGIIGRNGAGKSTLLKLLTKVTKPTIGSIKTRGRIASLLEVGTGFHPEMTGRENVFLNGVIMGMTRAEIKGKFDEIVDFAGVERYIDTPVKRYSSGMYVRLAFGVAAHLEPEILIVDEVLAVGDSEFQEKCLGKMKDVSVNEGRTVLFVSHDMNAVSNLTNNCMLLVNGKIDTIGKTDQIINSYLNKRGDETGVISFNPNIPQIKNVELKSSSQGINNFGDPLHLTVYIEIPEKIENLELAFQICKNVTAEPISYNWFTTSSELKTLKNKTGKVTLEIEIHSLRLYQGKYFFKFYLSDPRGKIVFHHIEFILPFEVIMYGINNEWGWPENSCKYIEKSIIQSIKY